MPKRRERQQKRQLKKPPQPTRELLQVVHPMEVHPVEVLLLEAHPAEAHPPAAVPPVDPPVRATVEEAAL